MPGIDKDMLAKLEVQPQSEAEVQAAFDAVLAKAQRAPTRLERLRRLPAPIRLGLCLAVGIGAAVMMVAVAGVRVDIGDIDPVVLGIGVTTLVAGSILAMIVAMRGPHQPELGRRAWMIAAALIVVPGLSPLVPGLWEGMPGSPPIALACLGMGFAAACLGAGALLLLSRWHGTSLSRVVLVGSSGGLMGFAAQALFCPAGGLAHQLIQHSSLALLAAIALLAARKVLIR